MGRKKKKKKKKDMGRPSFYRILGLIQRTRYIQNKKSEKFKFLLFNFSDEKRLHYLRSG